MSTIFQRITEAKIETVEQIESINDFIQVETIGHISTTNDEILWHCYKQELKIEVDSGYTFFSNCAFLGDVQVILNKCKTRIEFSNCIFAGKVSFRVTGDSNEYSCVDFISCNINCLLVRSRLDDLRIAYSTINDLIMAVKSRFVFFDSNIIYQFEPLEGVAEGGELILLDNEFKCLFDVDCKLEEYLFKSPGKQFDDKIKCKKDITKRNFYDALLKHSDLKFNRNRYAKYLFRKRLYSASNWFGKICVFLTGAFCFPLLFMLYAVLIIGIFGIAYYMIGGMDSSNITLLHALYYSGITFTTLGYGEIAEDTHQIIKLLSVIEAFVGVLISSSIITSFINKYSD